MDIDKPRKRSFEQIEDSSADVYEFSQNEHVLLKEWARKRHTFTSYGEHRLEIEAKGAAFKVSPSVVGLVSFSDGLVLSQASGTIVETDQNVNTLMTSLNLIRSPTKEDAEFVENHLANNLKIVVRASDDNSYIGEICTYDFHYNLLIIKFKSKAPLPCANLRMIDDDLNPEKSFQLRAHNLRFKPDDPIVVVGKYFYKNYDFMAASGYFRMKRCEPSEYDCRELLSATCHFPIAGEGGPLINLAGQVIGIAYYEIGPMCAVLPINIAYKWWDHFKRYMEARHPCYGFEASNIYVADMYILERLMKKFRISNGLLVEKVLPGSHAENAGLCKGDLILKCDGKAVRGFLELWDLMWEKVGSSVDLEVGRVNLDTPETLTMVVGEAIPNELNKWPQFDIPGSLAIL